MARVSNLDLKRNQSVIHIKASSLFKVMAHPREHKMFITIPYVLWQQQKCHKNIASIRKGLEKYPADSGIEVNPSGDYSNITKRSCCCANIFNIETNGKVCCTSDFLPFSLLEYNMFSVDINIYKQDRQDILERKL